MSIRLRLILTYSAVLVLVLLIFSITVFSVLHWALVDSVDRTLERAANQALDVVRTLPVTFVMLSDGTLMPRLGWAGENLQQQIQQISSANAVFTQIWTDSGQIIALGSPHLAGQALDQAGLNTREPTRRNVNVLDIPFRVLSYPVTTGSTIIGYIQVGQPIVYLQEAESRAAVVMILGSAFAFIASLFLGNALIERALHPIEDIASVASQITTGDDLSRRIPYSGPPDELGRLAVIFNATLGRLEALFQAQRRFVADVSHELRTPLTVIQGNVDIIRRYGPDTEALEAIAEESKRMTRLVGDLLLLAQADAGELPLITQSLELDTLLLTVYEQVRVLAGENGPAVTLGRFEPVRVQADPDRLKQLLLNLASNAVKHTHAGGTVTLSVWPDGPEALMTVADTGEGIPAEDLPHVFERFYRVDKARARKQGGAGLGLSIAQWIAEAHNGRITVTSAAGAGTTFTIRLPRQIPPPETLAETAVNMRPPQGLRGRAGLTPPPGKVAPEAAPAAGAGPPPE